MPYEPWASSAAARKTMQGNRRRDTQPELALRRAVHKLGLRYRVDAEPIRGVRRRADLLFARRRLVVYLDGCFWHGCPLHYKPPHGVNAEYWASKVKRNQDRDRQTDALLRDHGWDVIRIWEHDDPRAAAARIATAVQQGLTPDD